VNTFGSNDRNMIFHYSSKLVYSLLLLLFLLASCKGQIKTESQSSKIDSLIASQPGQPKLTKTQGSNEYQNIKCALQDKHGNIWFGTTEEGVYKYDGKLFTQFTMKDGLSSNNVWSILEDKSGTIWFGTGNGICRIEGNKIKSVPISFSLRPVIKDSSYYNDWSTRYTVWSMMEDRSGKIWFGTGDGVYCYEAGRFSRFLADNSVINSESLNLKLVTDMLEDKNGDIWFTSGMPPGYEGLCRYDGIKIESINREAEGWYRNIVQSKNGNLLLSTRHYGVWAYDGKSLGQYHQPKDLVDGSVNEILEDNAGNLWVAADYGKDMGDTLGGLWYSTSTSNSSVPSTSNSPELTFTKIFNREVYFIFQDNDNNIWFSTRGMGLYCYDRKEMKKYSE
jgi:ligand-binding sensor domain-containing protein